MTKMSGRQTARRAFGAGVVLAACLLLGFPGTGLAQLAINFIAVNASETRSKDIEVKYYLPPELEPDDVLDTGELKLEYDVDKGAYYAYKLMTFKPKESKTFKVKVKDIWRISKDEIDVLKGQLNENLALLEGKESYSFAQKARDKLVQQLDFILAQQENYSDNIERRIEEYRAYRAAIENIRNSAYDLDYLQHESKALDEMEQMKDVVKFVIEVENPYNEIRDIQHKHLLPEEVRAEDVLDRKDFEVRFNEKKNRAFLSKEESFNPGEKKRYEIMIKDIWKFPTAKLDGLKNRADLAMEELEGSVYEKSAQYLFKEIGDNITTIKNTSDAVMPDMEQHIGLYRVNHKRYTQALKDCERLEKMMSIVRAKKLEEMQTGRVQNVLQRLKALRGLAALSEAIFKRGISITMTWKIIFGTILFVAFFTGVHFFLWAKRSNKMGEELGLKSGETLRVVPKPGEAGTEET